MTHLKFALRQLLKNPGFTAVIVLTLAVRIGASRVLRWPGHQLLLQPILISAPRRGPTSTQRRRTGPSAP
jgi:putative ABC transport system permease protein